MAIGPVDSELRGHARLRAARRGDGATVLAGQSCCAPFHVGKPYWDGRVLQVQLVNSTAGILAGDELELAVEVETGAALAVTTPAAARAFMMRRGVARCRQHLQVAAGGWLEYLPEPLYPHRGSHYEQQTRVELAGGAAAFIVDQLAPGRVGRGECWAWQRLVLELEVIYAGRRLLRERLEASGPELARLAQFHGCPEAWFATAVVVGPGLPTAVDAPLWEAVRGLQREGCLCGVTAVAPMVWVVRLIAPRGLWLRDRLGELRGLLAAALPALQADHRKL